MPFTITLDLAQAVAVVVVQLFTLGGWVWAHMSKSDLQKEYLNLQQRLNREDEVWKHTVPPRLEDLYKVEQWLTDGLLIANDYVRISESDHGNFPSDWHKKEFRKLYHTRHAWEQVYHSEIRALSFRLAPSPSISSTDRDGGANLQGAAAMMYGIMTMLQKVAQQGDPEANRTGTLIQHLYDDAQKEIAFMRREFSGK